MTENLSADRHHLKNFIHQSEVLPQGKYEDTYLSHELVSQSMN